MTANQIALAKVREEGRHNRVSERHEHIDVRSRQRTALANSLNAETNARNATTNWWAAQESARHNLATERVSEYSAKALRDYQLSQSEALLRQAAVGERQASVAERNAFSTERQAAVSERQVGVAEKDLANKYRSSVANELNAQSSSRQAAVAEMLVGVRNREIAANLMMNQRQVALGYEQLAEQARHSKASERITDTHNLRTRAETKRHNEAMEFVDTTEMYHSAERARAATSQADSAARNATSNRIAAFGSVASGVARSMVALNVGG